ncbi:glycosyltransferase family 2 protein [Ligilactobacillus salivarius]|uniref:glycosyltransferase family 2 protein n=1 Tax=Ligilactobacillus salivarius TaxID=1624 RepID=UPI0029640193|nr:glycosyltransferase family 2 protein [Ligilactobacillus salivarius]WOX36713.1 glycosyltransferase family 2 protein [Ligilactobacillus salivarius]
MVKVSIGVPVYNVNDSLRACLDSILNQTYQDFEILLVDDGSTDGSYNICYEYAQKTDKIRYSHQNHQGEADTKNKILREADGEFITWVEATATIEPTYLEHLVKVQEESQADIVITGFKEYQSQNLTQTVSLKPYFLKLEEQEFVKIDQFKALLLFLSEWTSFFYGWGKLISMRTHLGVMYPKEFSNRDLATTYKLYLHTQNIYIDVSTLYNRNLNDERLTIGDRDLLADYEDKQRVLDEMMMITEIMNFKVPEVKDLCRQYMNKVYQATKSQLSENWRPKLDQLRDELA